MVTSASLLPSLKILCTRIATFWEAASSLFGAFAYIEFVPMGYCDVLPGSPPEGFRQPSEILMKPSPLPSGARRTDWRPPQRASLACCVPSRVLGRAEKKGHLFCK